MSERCVLHTEVERRLSAVEHGATVQIEENAKLWKAINTIREEKAKDSTVLAQLVDSVRELKIQMNDGFRELREEIEKLKSVPGKRWEALVGDIIKELVALAVGALAAYLVLKGGI